MNKHILLVLSLLLFISPIFSATIYVDATNGDDSYNGTSSSVGTFPNGPKATINAALVIANENDNIVLKSGNYNESISIKQSLNFIVNPNVVIKTIELNQASKTLNLIGQELHISDSLILKNGIIDVSTGLELHLLTNCKVIGGNKNSFVDGPLFINNSSTSSRTLFFPIGNNTDYRPIQITITQISSTNNIYKAQLSNMELGYNTIAPDLNRASKVHFWNLSKQGLSLVNNFSVQLHYDSAKTNDEVNDARNLAIALDSSGSLLNLYGNPTTNFEGTITCALSSEKWGNYTLANKISGINSLGHTKPFAKFAYKGNCMFSPISFIDSSYTTDEITQWEWDFDMANQGTSTSTAKNPQFTFNSVGPYTVQLIVTNSLGEKDTTQTTVKPYKLPTAKIAGSNVCFGDTFLTINNTSPSDSVSNWLWSVNGNTYTERAPKIYIAKQDTSTLQLIATNTYKCKDTATLRVIIYPKPSPRFSFQNTCLKDVTEFTNNSLIGKDTIIKNLWNINDKPTSSLKDFKHTFDSAKTYKITLATTSSHSCTDSIIKNITISSYPISNFGLANNQKSIQCFSNHAFQMKDSSINKNAGSLIYQWRTESGTQSNLAEPSFQFMDSGTYFIQQKITSQAGCSDSSRKSVTVLPKTSIDFTEIIPCFPDSLSFKASYTAPKDTIANIQWDLGDANSMLNLDSFKYEYKSIGTYQVELSMETKMGCKDTFSKSIKIEDRPLPKITALGNTDFCLGDSVQLQASGANSYTWSEGGNQNNTIWVKHTTKVILQGASTKNCFGYDSIEIKTFDLPNANAGRDTTITRGRSVQLNGAGGVKYKWTPNTFLDSDNLPNPISKPNMDITYYLVVEDANGCSDIDTVNVQVEEPGEIRIVNLLSPNGDGNNDFWDLSDLPELNTCHVTVYNRNGVVVFNTTDYQNDWDGTWEGKPLPEGTYFYYIHCDSEKEDFKGSILILR